jgi:lysophospholipase L1-like esterase
VGIAALRRVLSSLLLVVAGALFAIAVVEVYLRASGRAPAVHPDPVALFGGFHELDPVLGWRNRPGRHVGPRSRAEPERVTMTILQDGARTTGPGPARPAAEVIFVGCSFTQGWGLDDAETFAWVLQQRLPEVRVRNFGTGGYGTYQSILRVEQLLQTPAEVPRLIVYGFGDFHEQRNVAAASWLKALAAGSGNEARVPYCSFDRDGVLHRRPPIGYRTWPFHHHLASVRLLEERFAALAAPVRESQARAVTQALLGELDRIAERSDTRLVVAALAVLEPAKREYEAYAREHGVDLVDCTNREFERLSERLRLPGDQHPNATMNAIWAECLERALRPRLAELPPLR